MKHTVITIARSYGSGGRTLGKLLAKELGIHCYDRELLRMASEQSGINEALFGQVDEKVKSLPLFGISKKIYKGEVFPPESDDFVSDDNLFNYQAKVIKEVAAEESCVIIGRCADFILKDDKTYVLELGGRSGATCLAELVSIYYGYDYYEKLIRAALGEDLEFPQNQAVPNASMLLRSDRDGIIQSITNRNVEDPDICEIQFDYKVGDAVKKFHVGPHRIGHVVTKGETLDAAVKKLHEALDKIEIVVS